MLSLCNCRELKTNIIKSSPSPSAELDLTQRPGLLALAYFVEFHEIQTKCWY